MRIKSIICTALVTALTSMPIVSGFAENFRFDLSEQETVKDGSETLTREVRLCYAVSDVSEFTYVTRTFPANTVDELIECILAELTIGSGYGEAPTLFTGAALPTFELSGKTLTICLPIGTFANLTEQEILFACSAMANSFLALEEVTAVNILRNGRSFSIYGLPIGVYTQPVENAMLPDRQFESSRTEYQNGNFISQTALIYYPASNGAWYLPIPRDISVSSSDMFMPVLNALTQVDETESSLIQRLPSADGLLTEAPSIRVTESGERIVEIRFDTVLTDSLVLSGVAPGAYIGAIAISLLSYLPDISAVRFSIGDVPLETIDLCNGSTISLVDGMVKREYLTGCIGSYTEMYLPDSSGILTNRRVITGRHACTTLSGLMIEFFNACHTGGMTYILPSGISSDDVLGVSIEGSTAIVNMSSNFYTRCQALNEDQERLLAYSMINTLCTKTGIRSVRFIIEGREMDLFVHNICLSEKLLPDYGINIE